MIRAENCDHMNPEFPWLQRRVPDGYWNQRPHRIDYIDWLGMRLGFSESEDWYQLRNRDLNGNRGGSLLRGIYGSSVLAAMRDYWPEVEWIPWLFSKTPAGYWSVSENRQTFMSWLEKQLKISKSEDWYAVDDRDFTNNGGSGLLWNQYRGSVLSALREYRPDVDWKPWLFRKVPNGFWEDQANRRQYYHWLAGRIGYQSVKDWERLTREIVRDTRASFILERYFRGSMPALRADIQSCYD
jgi:hypothetical protein